MLKILFVIGALLLIVGCGVERISVKLTDFEYEGTEKGFKVYTDNYTDILINQDPITLSSLPNKVIPVEVKLNKTYGVEVKNDTIIIG